MDYKEPSCPKTYNLNKKLCRCIKTVKKKPAKRKPAKREPAKKTLKKTVKPKTVKPKTVKPKTVKKLPPKRCPNGTRRDKKTGLCLPKSTIIQKTQQKMIANKTSSKSLVIDNKSTLPELNITDAISKEFKSNKKTLFDVDKVLTEVSSRLVKNNSFSPAVNKMIISLRPGSYENVFNCGLTLTNVKKGKPILISIGSKMINGKEKPICALSTSKKAKSILLNNLKRIKTLDCNKIISPLQKQSNCWFNTMFIIFFISDKGRKFFRFFRQLMIEGKQSDGKIIKPPRLANALFLFNLCIEASISGSFGDKNNIALTMDTNNVIQFIHDSIPKSKKLANFRLGDITNKGEAGNPYSYYNGLINYLGNTSLRMEKIFMKTQIKHIFENNNNVIINELETVPITNIFVNGDYPDILVFTLYDKDVGEFGRMTKADEVLKPLQITMKYDKDSKTSAKYELDSAIIRDTSKYHFSACLTCNKVQKAYDGLSLSRMYNFNWKENININKQWEYKYKSDVEKMFWNFTSCYQLLFYYRV